AHEAVDLFLAELADGTPELPLAAEGHRAEAQLRNDDAALAEGSILHVGPPGSSLDLTSAREARKRSAASAVGLDGDLDPPHRPEQHVFDPDEEARQDRQADRQLGDARGAALARNEVGRR